MCGIYKITNKDTGKSYIGYSTNIEERWKQHLQDSYFASEEKWNKNKRGEQTHFHRALRNEGPEKFTFEILEECQKEELKEKEKYWVQKLDSFYNGYNMTKGGDGQLGICGELSSSAKLTQYQVNKIKQLLKQKKNYDEILEELSPLKISKTTIYDINYGISWFDEFESYPIAIDNAHRVWSKDEAMNLKYRYQNGELGIDLAKEQHVSLETMMNMLNGKTYKDLPVLQREVNWKRKSSKRKMTEEQVRLFRKQFQDGQSILSIYNNSGIDCNYAAFYNMIKGITYKNVL